jgi:hypothetical protein
MTFEKIAAKVPAELADDVRRSAVEADRTLSGEVRRALRLYIENEAARLRGSTNNDGHAGPTNES